MKTPPYNQLLLGASPLGLVCTALNHRSASGLRLRCRFFVTAASKPHIGIELSGFVRSSEFDMRSLSPSALSIYPPSGPPELREATR